MSHHYNFFPVIQLTTRQTQTHSRIMPFLLPPAPFKGQLLEDQQLNGTCEVQICRSAGNWSMGFQHRVEHSIQNAYLKGISILETTMWTTACLTTTPSYSNVRTLRIHREPVFHHKVSLLRIVLDSLSLRFLLVPL